MQAGCPHPPAGGHKGRPYTEARSAREQGNSETRRRKSSCAAGARCFLRRDEQLPVAEGAQRDNTEARSRREPRHSEPRRPENRPAEARRHFRRSGE
ncbi:hypothetical protein K200098A10_46240 [Flavonifractor plautii]